MDDLVRESHGLLQDRLGPMDSSCLPNYLVANEYLDGTQCIGEHTDCNTLFQTKHGPAVVFSFNVARDTFFVVKPDYKKLGMTSRQLYQGTDGKYVLPILAKAGSVLVMGGWFQKYMLHESLAHNDILRCCEWKVGDPRPKENCFRVLRPQR